jgi:threonine dehydrogenase-like Zn-dependent dehydrogenase
MRALVVTPGHLKIESVPDPIVGPFDVVCRMLYGAICAGTDTRLIAGADGDGVSYPSIIGHESIGEVVAVGSEVVNFTLGDRVTRVAAQESTVGLPLSWGGMCEFGVARDHGAMRQHGLPDWREWEVNQVIPPDLIDDVYAPMIITWRETHDYVRQLGVGSGDRVVVSGSGANGLSIAAMSVLAGATVVVIGSHARADAIAEVGAHGVDFRDEDAVARLVAEEVSNFSFLVDATGQTNSISHLLPLLRRDGIVGVYGMDDLTNYVLQPLNGPSRYSIYNGGYREPEAHEPVIELLRRGELDPTLWIDRDQIFGWHNVAVAYEAARTRTLIKPVVRLDSLADELRKEST